MALKRKKCQFSNQNQKQHRIVSAIFKAITIFNFFSFPYYKLLNLWCIDNFTHDTLGF